MRAVGDLSTEKKCTQQNLCTGKTELTSIHKILVSIWAWRHPTMFSTVPCQANSRVTLQQWFYLQAEQERCLKYPACARWSSYADKWLLAFVKAEVHFIWKAWPRPTQTWINGALRCFESLQAADFCIMISPAFHQNGELTEGRTAASIRNEKGMGKGKHVVGVGSKHRDKFDIWSMFA